MTKLLPFIVILTLCVIQSAQANIEVHFLEGAPKDKFVIKNTGNCLLKNLLVEIDLSQSVGKLIFDTTASGAGVEVFQPFEVTEGDIKLATQKTVQDGDAKLALNISTLSSGKSASFTIDVDDTLAVSELGKIRVAGSEIKNGLVKIRLNNQNLVEGVFGSNSKATVLNSSCSS